MKKMRKCVMKNRTGARLRVFVLMGVLFSVFTFMPQRAEAAVTTHTQAEAISWCQAQANARTQFGAGWCTEFVQAYYSYLGAAPYTGSATNYQTAAAAVPSGWVRIKGATPQKGDVLLYNNHVAVFNATNSTYHQRFNNHTYVEHVSKPAYNGFTTPYWGVIRPQWKSPDTTKPVVSNARISSYDEYGYTVTCTATDNTGVDRVQFPTWTSDNGQDDLDKSWGSSSAVRGCKNGNTYTFRVKRSDHSNETGIYNTHIYAYDKQGNRSNAVGVSINFDTVVDNMANAIGRSVEDGDYHIVSSLDESYGLDVYGAFTSIRTNVQIYQNTNDQKQVFTLQYLGSGYYLISQKISGNVLDVYGRKTANKTNVWTYSYNGTSAEQWILKPTGDGRGSYYIYSRCSGTCLDVQDGKAANFTNVQMYQANQTKAQRWLFVPVPKETPRPNAVSPKAVSLKKITAGKKTFKAYWNKQSSVSGYQIQYSKTKTFTSDNKTVTIKTNNCSSKKISGLTRKRKYYVRIRTYVNANGMTYYSSWSKTNALKTK